MLINHGKQVVDTLTLPVKWEPPYPDGNHYAYWLKLADIALGNVPDEHLVVEISDMKLEDPNKVIPIGGIPTKKLRKAA